jgi:hypothetical protein
VQLVQPCGALGAAAGMNCLRLGNVESLFVNPAYVVIVIVTRHTVPLERKECFDCGLDKVGFLISVLAEQLMRLRS